MVVSGRNSFRTLGGNIKKMSKFSLSGMGLAMKNTLDFRDHKKAFVQCERGKNRIKIMKNV